MSLHGSDKQVLIGTPGKVQHRIQNIDLELVPDHLSLGGAGPGIPNGTIVSNTLNGRYGFLNYRPRRNACRDHRPWRDIPADPWGERAAGFFERIEYHDCQG